MLSNWKFYRRIKGGKWEQWYVDHPVCSLMWFQVKEFTEAKTSRAANSYGNSYVAYYREWMDPRHRPSPLCRGNPVTEDYTE